MFFAHYKTFDKFTNHSHDSNAYRDKNLPTQLFTTNIHRIPLIALKVHLCNPQYGRYQRDYVVTDTTYLSLLRLFFLISLLFSYLLFSSRLFSSLFLSITTLGRIALTISRSVGVGGSKDEERSAAARDLLEMGSFPTTLYPPTVPFLVPSNSSSLQSLQSPSTSARPPTTPQNLDRNRDQIPKYCPTYSTEMSQLCETIFATAVQEKYHLKTRTAAINIIRNLFLKRIKDIESVVEMIPSIPNIPELKSVQFVHQQRMEDHTLDYTLRILGKLLLHDSSFVRKIVLRKIYRVFVDDREKILSLLGGDVSTTGGLYVLPENSGVSLLLQELLQLCSKDMDSTAIDLCARCLG